MKGKYIFLAVTGASALACSNQVRAQAGEAQAASPARAPAASATDAQAVSTTSNQATNGSDIVVTASRSKEILRKAPVAVTVLTQDELTKSGANDIQTLASTAPNVQIGTIGFDNATFVSIRGISNTDPTPAGNPAVSTYIDGIYVGQTGGLAGSFYDLDRLEVLRGPQGTLYGRNSTGGNLNLYTADPVGKFKAAADLSYGNYNDVQARATINLPISDKLSVRFAGIVHRNDGYVDTNGATARNYAQANDFGGRVTVLWKPFSEFSWRISADNFSLRGTPGKIHRVGSDGKFVDEGAPYHPTTDPFPEPINDVDNLFIRSRMEYQIGSAFTIAYLAGYQRVKQEIQFAWNGKDGVIDSSGFAEASYKSQSHEITISYDGARFKNIAGASVFTADNHSGAIYPIPFAGILFGVINEGGYFQNAKGVFDQATLELLPGFKVIGGLRYSSESAKSLPSRFVYCTPVAPFIGQNLSDLLHNLATLGTTDPTCTLAPNAIGNGEWNTVTWKAGVTLDISDNVSGYATATTGFKSGGFNAGSTQFDPEKIINYEIGLKAKALDGRLNVNTAAFLANYRDLQVLTQSGVLFETSNAAAARIKGIETEARFQITPDDRISGFATYLDSRFTDYSNAADPYDNVVFANLRGNRLPSAPRYSARLSYAHDFRLNNGGLITASANSYWQDKMYLRVFNRQIDKISGYLRSNADLTYMTPGQSWTISAFIYNIEGNIRRNSAYNSSGLYESEVNPPRTFGVRIGAKY